MSFSITAVILADDFILRDDSKLRVSIMKNYSKQQIKIIFTDFWGKEIIQSNNKLERVNPITIPQHHIFNIFKLWRGHANEVETFWKLSQGLCQWQWGFLKPFFQTLTMY